MNIIKKWISMEGMSKVVERILFAVCGLIIIYMAKPLT